MLSSNSFREREALLVISGIVLLAASPVGVLIGGTAVRYGILATGFGLLFWASVCRYYFSGIAAREFPVLLGIIVVVESINAINLADPLNPRLAVFRWICYGMTELGMMLGAFRTGSSQSPSSRCSVIPLIITIVSVLWIVRASTSDTSVRFHGDTDELSPVGVGYTFGLLATVSLGFVLTEVRPQIILLHFAAMALAMTAQISTGSRGSMVAFAVVFCFGSIVKTISAVNVLRFLAVLLLASCALYIAHERVPYFRDQADFIASRFDFATTGRLDDAILERVALRDYYYETIDHWIMFGYRSYEYRYPHNLFFELAVRFGFFGILLSVAISALSIRAVVLARIVYGDIVGLIILLTGLFTLIVAQFNMMLEFERCLWLFLGYWWAKPNHTTPSSYTVTAAVTESVERAPLI